MRKENFSIRGYRDQAALQTAPVGRTIPAVLALAAAASMGMVFPAFADGLTVTDGAIRDMLNSTIDIVFLIFSVGIAVMGAFQLIPAIIHFIQASNSQNGEQRKEAGSGIGTSIMILLLAGLVFMLKTPLKSLVGLGA
jgi:hypothetical protein